MKTTFCRKSGGLLAISISVFTLSNVRWAETSALLITHTYTYSIGTVIIGWSQWVWVIISLWSVPDDQMTVMWRHLR